MIANHRWYSELIIVGIHRTRISVEFRGKTLLRVSQCEASHMRIASA